MNARAVDDAAIRLRELRQEEWGDLGLAALTLCLAITATEYRPALALPLFLGGLLVWVLGVRALYKRWELVDRLSEERDAYVIAEVAGHAARVAAIESRRTMACSIRATLADPGPLRKPRVHAVRDELAGLAADLENTGLELDPASAVACRRLLHEFVESPLLNPALPPEALRPHVRRIRAGFAPCGRAG